MVLVLLLSLLRGVSSLPCFRFLPLRTCWYLKGKCKFGDSCSFSHQPRGRLPVCRFFEKSGSCRYGNSCKFLHGAPAGGAPTTPAHAAAGQKGAAAPGSSGAPACEASAACTSSAACAGACGEGGAGAAAAAAAECGEREHKLDAGDNCGICLENIPSSGKRFGLLNCDHVYCLGTCGRWRGRAGLSVTSVRLMMCVVYTSRYRRSGLQELLRRCLINMYERIYSAVCVCAYL